MAAPINTNPILSMLFQDVEDQNNFNKLSSRKEGEYFEVKLAKLDNGTTVKRLEVVTGCSNKLRFWKESKWKETAKLVNELMEKLNERVGVGSLYAYSKSWQQLRKELKPLFDKNGAIGRLSSCIFNRKRMEGNNLDLITMNDWTARVAIEVDGSKHYIYTRHNYTTADPYHIDLNLGTSRLNHNFLMLVKRGRGIAFHVRSQDMAVARLQTVSGLTSRISYCWNRAEKEKAVKAVVGEVVQEIEKIDLEDSRCVNVLQHFFQNGGAFTRLSENVFDRGCVKECGKLERALFPQLQEKRACFQAADKNDKRAYEEAFKNYSYMEFLFAQSLGIGLQGVSSGGTGGARFGYSRYGKTMAPVWVLKPSDEGPNGTLNPSRWQRIKSFFISQRTSLQDNSEACAEVDAALLDRAFDINMVPPTMRQRVTSSAFYGRRVKECSLQMFVEGAKTLREHLGIPSFMHFLPRSFLRWYYVRESKRKEFAAKLPVELVERLAALNFQIEDFDCHLDNCLVLRGDTPYRHEERGFFGTGENQKVLRGLFHAVKGVMLIKHDNGSSNPHSHPEFSYLHPIETYLSQRYRYFFEILPMCAQTFSPATAQLMKGKEREFGMALEEKAKLALRSMMGPLEETLFEDFWTGQQDSIRLWIASGRKQKALVADLVTRTNKELSSKYQNSPEIYRYYEYHLSRIHNSLKSRIESYKVLLHHFDKQKDNSMRDLLTGVRYKSDFVAILKPPKKTKAVAATA